MWKHCKNMRKHAKPTCVNMVIKDSVRAQTIRKKFFN